MFNIPTNHGSHSSSRSGLQWGTLGTAALLALSLSACGGNGGGGGGTGGSTGAAWSHQAYVKAPNAQADDLFGLSVAISGDTLVVGAPDEDSNQTTITSTASSNNSASSAGAAYVFVRSGSTWAQQAYLKAPNAEPGDAFGISVAISGDTLVVGALEEDSNQTTVTSGSTASSDNSAGNAGAAYVFVRSGSAWAQQAYLKAPNAQTTDRFGSSVAISGETLVVGSPSEDSNQTTVTNGSAASSDNSASDAGAAYVFVRSGATWAQQAYLKAPNAGTGDGFGASVAISGSTIVVGAPNESSNQTTITHGSSASANNSDGLSGAAYVFVRNGATWTHQAYLKASIAASFRFFGQSVAIDGDTLVVGAGNDDLTSYYGEGAAYVFARNGSTWSQQARLKASNPGPEDLFGTSVSISGDTIVVGAPWESSNQTTITHGGTASNDDSAFSAGAAYVFTRSGTTWSQQAYLKAPNAETDDEFGIIVAVDDGTIVVGVPYEGSNQTTITHGSAASANNSATYAGAAYVFQQGN